MLTRWRSVPRPVRFAVVGTTLIAFVLVATGLIALLSARPALAASSTLTVLGGTVAVREGAGDFAVAQDGQLVGPGMTIRTGPRSHAVLTYVDGSTVTIEPESELAIEQLEVSAQGDLVAVVSQAFGRSWHVVASRIGPTGRYEVRAPSATATVRGTAFQFNVLRDGALELETADGIVATSGGGTTVDVSPGQITTVPPNAAPAPPAPAPEPQAVVRITLSPTANGVAVDQSGRSVGVQNGQPLRYVPGSKVELINGQLVLTIPTNDPGRISTVVKPDVSSPQTPVQIQTQVVSNGSVVANTVEQRRVDGSGTAKGGVVLTTAGVIVLPDSEAKSFGAPIIGKVPERPSSDAPKPTPLVTSRPPASATPQPTGTPPTPPTGATFLGGFQAFGTGATTGTLVRFTGEIPKELLPPAPPSKDGCPPFATECTRLRFVPDPSPAAAPLIDLTDRSFIPKEAVLPTAGIAVFTRPDPALVPGAPARPESAEGCERTVFGVICKGAATPPPPASPGSTLPPDFGGAPAEPRTPSVSTPAPTAAGGFFPSPLPLITPVLRTLSPIVVTPPPSFTPPPTATPCVSPEVLLPDGRCATPTPTPAPTTSTTICVPPDVLLATGKCGPAPTPTPAPTTSICVPPDVLLTTGKCGPAPTPAPTPTCESQGLIGIAPNCTRPTPAPTPTPTCAEQGMIGTWPACAKPTEAAPTETKPPDPITCVTPFVLRNGVCSLSGLQPDGAVAALADDRGLHNLGLPT